MSAVAQGLTGTADTLNRRADIAVGQARAVDAEIRAVGQETDVLAQAVEDIRSQAHTATDVSSLAAAEAHRTETLMARLDTSSAQIGDVVDAISSITDQTRMLALNATIEAARAGEVGKGFAVVAGEVKTLAGRTAEATGTAGGRLAAVRDDAKAAVDAIGEITATIDAIGASQAEIDEAVSRQQDTTRRIRSSIAQAEAGARQVGEVVADVAEVAAQTLASAEDTNAAAADLSRVSERLVGLVRVYRT